MSDRDYHRLPEPKDLPRKELPEPVDRRTPGTPEQMNAEITGESAEPLVPPDDPRRDVTIVLDLVRAAMRYPGSAALPYLERADELLVAMDARTGRRDPSVRDATSAPGVVTRGASPLPRPGTSIHVDADAYTLNHAVRIAKADFDRMSMSERRKTAAESVEAFRAALNRLWSLGE